MVRFFLFVSIIIFLNACASYRAQYEQKGYVSSLYEMDDDPNSYTMYLIGDAGNAPEGKTTHVLKYLKKLLDSEESNSCVVWLGDNIYPVGLAPENHADYKLGKHRINKQIEVHSDYNGKVYFMPGNHDWYTFGKEGVIRQEIMIEDSLSSRPVHNSSFQNNYFLPDSAAGAVNLVDLNSEIALLILDSAWFISHGAKTDEEGIDFNLTRKHCLDEITRIITDNTDKTIIVTMHHPLYTYGSHGGKFPFKDYMFPLAQLNKALVLPLPFTGIIVNKMRNYISDQDTKHATYKLLMNHIESTIEQLGSTLIVGGHEHNMQYIEKNDNYIIVSGAGSKRNPCGLGEGSAFCIGEKGFVKLEFSDSKNVQVKYLVVDSDGLSAQQVFHKQLKLGN